MPDNKIITTMEIIADTEKAVLGALLLRPKQCLPVVMNILTPNDFIGGFSRRIFEIIIALDQKNTEIDAITVNAEFINSPDGSQAVYLSDLYRYCIPSNVEDHAQKLKEFSRRRQLDRVAQEIKTNLLEGLDSEKIISTVLDGFSEIQNEKVKEFKKLKDLIGPVYEEVKNGMAEGLMTGFTMLDKTLKGFHPQNLIFIASGAGKGKTSLALNLTVQFLSRGYIGVLYSLEMSDIELVKRFLAIVSETNSNVSNADLEAFGSTDDTQRRFKAAGLISTYGLAINDRRQDIKSLESSAKVYAVELKRKKEKLDFVVVDYLQLLDATNDEEIREQQVSKMSKGLKRLARDLNVPVFAVAQTNRLAEKEKKRDYKLFDLRESGAIEQDADVVMFLNDVDPDKEPDKYKLDVAKNRHGAGCFQMLRFEKTINKFIEVENEHTA